MALISDRGVALGFVLCMASCNVLADRAQGEWNHMRAQCKQTLKKLFVKLNNSVLPPVLACLIVNYRPNMHILCFLHVCMHAYPSWSRLWKWGPSCRRPPESRCFRLRSCDKSFSAACVAADCWLHFTGGGGVFMCSLCLLHLLLLSVSCRLAAMVAATSLLQQNSSRVFVPQLQEF